MIVVMMVVAMQKSGDLDRDCGYDGGCDGYEKNIDCLEDVWWLVMVGDGGAGGDSGDSGDGNGDGGDGGDDRGC